MEATKTAKIPRSQKKSNEFLTILKKDIREVVRTKRLFLYTMIATAMLVFTWILLGVMQIFIKYVKMPSQGMNNAMQSMFALDIGNIIGWFTNMMAMYFMVAIVIFIRNIVSKEIAENKWTLPLQSGIKPWKLLVSKFLVYLGAVLFAIVVTMLVHIVIAIIVGTPQTTMTQRLGEDTIRAMAPEARALIPELAGWAEGSGAVSILIKIPISYGAAIGNAFANFAHIIVAMTFIVICVMTINTITKKSWPAIVVPLAFVIVASPILSQITFGAGSEVIFGETVKMYYTLLQYTPLLFFEAAGGGGMMSGGLAAPTVVHYVSASLVTIAICVGLVFWAVRKSKVRGLQDKRAEE